MAVWDDLAAIANNQGLTVDEKRIARHAVKVASLVDILNNGKPPPNPLPKVVGATFTLDGYSITLHSAQDVVRGGSHVLRLAMTVRLGAAAPIISVSDDIYIVNPPSFTWDRRQDLIETAKEIIANEIARALRTA